MSGDGAGPAFEPAGSVAVVTGGAGGIGIALVRELASRGAATVVLADLDPERTRAVAAALDAEHDGCRVVGHPLDVRDRTATADLVGHVEDRVGPVDLWCANAGVATAAGVDAEPDVWEAAWSTNVMAHVHAAASLVPRWVSRGRGHLLVTASAAGLLTNLGDAPYSATKHAAVGFAEWVAITHGDDGVGVTCLCPQGVRTPLLYGAGADEFADLGTPDADPTGDDPGQALAARTVRSLRVLEPAEVAACALDAAEQGRFLALPHDEVRGFEAARAADHDRWIRSMRRMLAGLTGTSGPTDG